MRPLWRWTIGDVTEVGWQTLFESVRHAVKIYPDFDFVICHNHLSHPQEMRLQALGVPLHRQDDQVYDFQYISETGEDYSWKLNPPRLRLNAHELWVDNDIVIRRRIGEIDQWLQSPVPIISTPMHLFPAKGGRYQKMIQNRVNCCAGFFGLPPGFDLEIRIKELCDTPLYAYDEQGLVIYIVTEEFGWIGVPHEALKMLGIWNHHNIDMTQPWPAGLHFCGANRTEDLNWPPWKCYQLGTT